MNCDEIFTAIIDRQIEALMFHDQMADYFDFMNLHGFKRMHEYQYCTESVEYRKTKRYFINHHSKLISDSGVKAKNYIPADWFNHRREDVSGKLMRQKTEEAFSLYREWEAETLRLYQEYAKMLLDMGHVSDFEKVSCLACDVSCELKKLDRLKLKLSDIDYDGVYIEEIQDELHTKYKKKMKKIAE
jgi:hypothetical protein